MRKLIAEGGEDVAQRLIVLGLAILPALLATLPLALNGSQQILAAMGRVSAPNGGSAVWGCVMIAAAVLPYVAGVATAWYVHGKDIPRREKWNTCAAAVFFSGLAAFFAAMLLAV
ncbi:hypothetical protein ACIOC1_20335 [Streptomyces sp. NPDC088197]|uniref:hypothetical protein n=1 Tax=Streptomyces sp. NPDC088197 TaxID=3365840 RepID=UPI00381D4E5D